MTEDFIEQEYRASHVGKYEEMTEDAFEFPTLHVGVMYIAGPMSNIPHFNYPAFNSAAAIYRELGYEVFNPAENDLAVLGTDVSADNTTGSVEQATQNHGFSYRGALHDDLGFITSKATHIFMLKGWEKSQGAFAEWAAAKACGLKIIYE